MEEPISHTELPASLGEYPALFATLEPIPETAVAGIYRAEFVGPGWLRAIAPPGLKILGLGGWWGKWLQENGDGTNIVFRHNQLEPYMPVTFAQRASLLDGKPCLAVLYPQESPFPWRHVTDELRVLDNGRYLGMTITDLPLARSMPLPFVLHANPTNADVDEFIIRYTKQITS